MNKPVNFLNKPFAHSDAESDKKKPNVMRLLFYPLVFGGIFLLVFSFQVLLSGEGLGGGSDSNNDNDGFSFLNVLGFSNDRPLKGEEDDRINILLTGMGGLGHSGPFLTDTIILASYKPSTHEVAMLSIPRDLSVNIPGYGWRRINSVNHYGELNNPRNGAAHTADFMSQLLNIPIHYHIRVDFQGFIDVIDDLGGIDVYVENSFTDSQFPTDNYGYKTISFEKGWNTMGGEQALDYARSRHGNNAEGSDFARSQRQQKVLKAVKDKLLSMNTFFNIRKLNALYEAYQNNVSTNMETWEIIRFAKEARHISDDTIKTLVLDNSADGLLYSTIVNGAYLLVPRDQSYYEIHQVVQNMFNPPEQVKRIERATLDIRNGTKTNGLAYSTSVQLTKMGFEVEKIGNAVTQDYEKTVIYDLTQGQKNMSLERLTTFFNANVTSTLPEWLAQEAQTSDQADFLIVLGTDFIDKQ